MRATEASFQRLEQVRDRQQLLCGIHLRHVGRFDFAGGILNHKLYALQERKPWNLTKPSNGANENKVFLGMAGKWDARNLLSAVLSEPNFLALSFYVLGEVKAMQWVGPEYSKHEDNWDSTAVFARVGFLPSSFSSRRKERSLRRWTSPSNR